MSDLNSQEINEASSELKRCISRLTFVGMGHSKELDSALADLRDVIKSNGDEKEIKNSVDTISSILRNLEDKEPELKSSNINLAVKETHLIELLLENKLPVKLKIALKKERKKSEPKKAEEIAMSIANAINDFIGSIEANLEQDIAEKSEQVDTKENQKKKGGFFANLFKKENTDDSQVDSNHVENGNANNEKLDKNSLIIPQDVKDSLQHFVEQLAALDTYHKVTKKLADKVNKVNLVSDLSEVVEMLTGAFVEVSGLEHRQFEIFLKSLNKRIDRVNEFITNTINYSQQVKDESNLLDQDLKTSVSSIKTSVDNANSLSEVKKNIYTKMDDIIKRVNRFYLQQEASSKNLSSNLESLQEQLKATETESSRLREDLAAQKIRAQTDPLTQLPNRYSYNEQLTQEYNRWRRYRNPLTLVIGDIDYFKKINDQYGHAGGDEVLKQISVFFRDALRESDFIARFGGEEFIILLPETDIIAATKTINKLRLSVKDLIVEFDGHKIQFAMSFGISEFEDDDTPKRVFERADKALYRAKEKGRDQVCCQRAKAKD